MEFSPQQFTGLFDFLPWVWARCPGWRGVVQVPNPLASQSQAGTLSS